jgi:hypothetical protein
MDIELIKRVFGEFEYVTRQDGSIVIVGEWVQQNIVKVPINENVLQIHRLIEPQVKNILIDLGCANLIEEFDITHGGGGFCPRHILWNHSKPLSLHSWGIAIDLNPIKYPYGSTLKPRNDVIDIFTANGFSWGGYWQTKDPMHLEWRSFVK